MVGQTRASRACTRSAAPGRSADSLRGGLGSLRALPSRGGQHPPGRRPACRFRIADADRDGVLTGAEAVSFFQRSGLPQQTLFKVWQMISWRGA